LPSSSESRCHASRGPLRSSSMCLSLTSIATIAGPRKLQ
jgi:hypothetical protein